MTGERPGLGRVHVPDSNDCAYLLGEPPPQVIDPARTRRTWWAGGAWLDQGSTPQCVAYSLSHFYVDGPVTHKVNALPPPGKIYTRAQALDGLPMPHDGTTVRAGAKVLQALGVIDSYRWAFDLDSVLAHLLHVGPVVVGSVWYEQMFTPDKTGLLHVAGPPVGGHAYVWDGVNTLSRRIRVKNSWGRGWGRDGFASLSFEDAARLLHEDGEAMVAIEHADPRTPANLA